jgi:hypothetical protein
VTGILRTRPKGAESTVLRLVLLLYYTIAACGPAFLATYRSRVSRSGAFL